MTTQQLIAFIQKKVSGYTPSEILLLINQVHELILSKANYFKLYTDSVTGMPPLMATVNGTYEYSLPSNARISIAVFTKDLTGYTCANSNMPLARYRYGVNDYFTIPTNKTPAFGNTPAKVIFIDNPPTASDRYYHLYALKPAQIIAPTIQLELPSEFHIHIRQGVLALIRDEKYGERSDWREFEAITVPMIQNNLNAMCRPMSGSTQTQPEYRDY
jgi:hypothetical protein